MFSKVLLKIIEKNRILFMLCKQFGDILENDVKLFWDINIQCHGGNETQPNIGGGKGEIKLHHRFCYTR